jgi:DNA-binding transcriptional ArsR family regulator
MLESVADAGGARIRGDARWGRADRFATGGGWVLLLTPGLLSTSRRLVILNYMVQYSTTLDGTFAALSDPTRRKILERLANGEATVSELARMAGMSLTGLKKHVGVLERAELVSTEKRGRTRHCRLGPQRLDDAGEWIERYRRGWEERFEHMEEVIEKRKGASR